MWGRKRREAQKTAAAEEAARREAARERLAVVQAEHDAKLARERAHADEEMTAADQILDSQDAAHEPHLDAENEPLIAASAADPFADDETGSIVENEAWVDDESQDEPGRSLADLLAERDKTRVFGADLAQDDGYAVRDGEVVDTIEESLAFGDGSIPDGVSVTYDPELLFGTDTQRVLRVEEDVVVHSLAEERRYRSLGTADSRKLVEDIRGPQWPVGGLFLDLNPNMLGCRLLYVAERTTKVDRRGEVQPAFEVVNLVHADPRKRGERSVILAYRLLDTTTDGRGRWFDPIALPEAGS